MVAACRARCHHYDDSSSAASVGKRARPPMDEACQAYCRRCGGLPSVASARGAGCRSLKPGLFVLWWAGRGQKKLPLGSDRNFLSVCLACGPQQKVGDAKS